MNFIFKNGIPGSALYRVHSTINTNIINKIGTVSKAICNMINQLDLTRKIISACIILKRNKEGPIDVSIFIIGPILKGYKNCQHLIFLLNSSFIFRKFPPK